MFSFFSFLRKAQVITPLKAPVMTISTVATTLGMGGDTSIEDINS